MSRMATPRFLVEVSIYSLLPPIVELAVVWCFIVFSILVGWLLLAAVEKKPADRTPVILAFLKETATGSF